MIHTDQTASVPWFENPSGCPVALPSYPLEFPIPNGPMVVTYMPRATRGNRFATPETHKCCQGPATSTQPELKLMKSTHIKKTVSGVTKTHRISRYWTFLISLKLAIDIHCPLHWSFQVPRFGTCSQYLTMPCPELSTLLVSGPSTHIWGGLSLVCRDVLVTLLHQASRCWEGIEVIEVGNLKWAPK